MESAIEQTIEGNHGRYKAVAGEYAGKLPTETEALLNHLIPRLARFYDFLLLLKIEYSLNPTYFLVDLSVDYAGIKPTS